MSNMMSTLESYIDHTSKVWSIPDLSPCRTLMPVSEAL